VSWVVSFVRGGCVYDGADVLYEEGAFLVDLAAAFDAAEGVGGLEGVEGDLVGVAGVGVFVCGVEEGGEGVEVELVHGVVGAFDGGVGHEGGGVFGLLGVHGGVSMGGRWPACSWIH
jgi:hypothetical protein